jgi:hypothetical protein
MSLEKSARFAPPILIAASLLLLGAVAVDGNSQTWVRAVVIITCACLLLLAFWLDKKLGALAGSSSLGSPVLPTLLDQFTSIYRAKAEAAGRYSLEQTLYFTSILQDQKLFLSVVESAELVSEQSVLVTTRFNLGIAPSLLGGGLPSPPQLAVPLLQLERGAAIEKMSIRDAAGAAVTTITDQEMQGLLALAIDLLYRRAAFGSSTSAITSPQHQAALGGLTLLACGIGKNNSTKVTSRTTPARAILSSSVATGTGLAYQAEYRGLINLCTSLANSYLIGIVLPEFKVTTVDYVRSVPAQNSLNLRSNRWRNLAGLSLSSAAFPLLWPFLTPSYQFTFRCRGSQYVAGHDLYNLTDAKDAEQTDFDHIHPRPYLRLRRRRITSDAQLIVRGLNLAPTKELITTMSSEEIPPGGLLPAGIVAAASAALVIVFTYWQPGLPFAGDASATSNSNSDLPALLLALPALAASLFGHSAERLRETSITAFLSFVVALITSAAAALTYVLDANNKLRTPIPSDLSLFWGMIHFPRTTWQWLALSVVSSLTLLVIVRQMLKANSRYFAVIAATKLK